MRLVADENCDRVIIAALREAGLDVVSIREKSPGMSDSEIFDFAAAEERILLTGDQGFGLMAERVRPKPPAIVLMRLDPLLPATRTKVAVDAILALKEHLLGQLTVIEPHQIRGRPLKY